MGDSFAGVGSTAAAGPYETGQHSAVLADLKKPDTEVWTVDGMTEEELRALVEASAIAEAI